MRIAIAGLLHESNTFNPLRTDRAAFAAQGLALGTALLAEWRAAHHEVGGFLESAERLGFEPVPLVMAWATPSGPVVPAVLDELVGVILDGLRQQRPDGLLLALHGAMVAEGIPDADGAVLTRLRQAVGPDFPIVVTFDLHGNLSERAAACCTAAVAYRTNPHVDQRECGQRAASLLVRTLRGEIRPTVALAKPPVLVNIMVHDSSQEPLQTLLAEARSLEERPGILAVSLLPGFAYSDVPQMGPAVLVVADDQPELAQRTAQELAGKLWDRRAELVRWLPDATSAVAQAKSAPRLPVILVDTGDNVGGGSAADGTTLLAELLRQDATDSVVCLYDPEAARQCAAAGIGAAVQLQVGGKVDRLHDDSVAVSGRVKVLHDGVYLEPEVRHGGKRLNHMGLTALIELAGNNLLVLNSLRHPPFSLGQLTCLGIQPRQQRILVVKAAIAYKAAYAPLGGTIIEVDTPGVTAVNPARFVYRHVRRPMYPLDAEC